MDRSLLLLVAALCASGCGEPAPEPFAGDTFIALQRDFDGFEAWESHAFEVPDTGATHEPGPRTVYLNARPPSGSTSFPVGTVIVKVATAADGTETIFAMAKRGGTFNAAGATGWEWFELARGTTGAPVIVWRGVGAPAGHRYSAVDASCNDCHRAAAGNDFVQAEILRLSGF